MILDENKLYPDSCGLRVMILEGGAGFREIICCGHSLTASASSDGRVRHDAAVRRRHRESARTETPNPASRLSRLYTRAARGSDCSSRDDYRRAMRHKTDSMKQWLTWMEWLDRWGYITAGISLLILGMLIFRV